jgi:hypothetical protein
MKKTIFEQLEKKEIHYAVSLAYFRRRKSSDKSRGLDYYLILDGFKEKEIKELKLKYKESSTEQHNIFERDLTEDELAVFKKTLHRYVRVKDDDSGSIWELIGKSFKENYDRKMLELKA